MKDPAYDSGYDFSVNPHAGEARARFGDDAVDRSEQYLAKLPDDAKTTLGKRFAAELDRLAALRGLDPADHTVQDAIGDYFNFLNTHFGYVYSREAFAGLGHMYAADSRFTETIDRHGSGLAVFLAAAMRIFADRA